MVKRYCNAGVGSIIRNRKRNRKRKRKRKPPTQSLRRRFLINKLPNYEKQNNIIPNAKVLLFVEMSKKFDKKVQFCKVDFAKLKKNRVKCIFFTEKFAYIEKM